MTDTATSKILSTRTGASPARCRDDHEPRSLAYERPDAVPERVWAELCLLRSDLEMQGSVVRRRGKPGCYRVRVRSRVMRGVSGLSGPLTRHRSLELHGEQAAASVRKVITYWRSLEGRRDRRLRQRQLEQDRESELLRRRPEKINELHEKALAEDRARSELHSERKPRAVPPRPPPPVDDEESPQLEVNPAAQDTMAMTRFPRNAPALLHRLEDMRDDPEAARKDSETLQAVRRRADAAWHTLPTSLRARLLKITGALRQHGTIARRKEHDRRGGFRLRVRAAHPDYGRTHVSVPVPEEHLQAVWHVMLGLRAPFLAEKAKRMRLQRKLTRLRAETRQSLRCISLLRRDDPAYMDMLFWIKTYLCLTSGVSPFKQPQCWTGHAADGSG